MTRQSYKESIKIYTHLNADGVDDLSKDVNILSKFEMYPSYAPEYIEQVATQFSKPVQKVAFDMICYRHSFRYQMNKIKH